MNNISRSWVEVLICHVLSFGVLHLSQCDFAMDLTMSMHKCCSNLEKRVTETLVMIRQSFGEESMGRTWVFEWHVQPH
jgi:hypothetical protein